MTADVVYQIAIWAVPVLLAITLHEAAHAWTASRLGDDTAYRLGRVTFNPLRHVDPFGTVVLPLGLFLLSGFMFGWAKPVPIAFHKLHRPRRDMVLVALAGPAANVILAVISAWLVRWVWLLPDAAAMFADRTLRTSIFINILLAIFNMLPLPPLDGGRVAVGILPDRLAVPLVRLERYGLAILLGFLLVLPMVGRQFGVQFNLFAPLILEPTLWAFRLIARIMGIG